ncbi:hypothetical protein N336_12429, partial [Phalacrocorax carbo]
LTLEKAAYNIWLLHLHPKGSSRLEGSGGGEGLFATKPGWGPAGRVAWGGGQPGTTCSSAQSQPGEWHLP